MSDKAHHPDIKELVEAATRLEDSRLNDLSKAVLAELARRDTIKNGLDAGERLQFDTAIDMIRERTKLSITDALAMIRAHEPGRVRGPS